MKRHVVFLAITAVLGATATSWSQEEAPQATPAKMYEGGHYEAVANQVKERGEAPPEDVFWAAQSLRRLDRGGEAVEMFRRLGGEDEQDPWRLIGRSAAALAEGQQEQALQQATRAAEVAPDLFYAHYQLGLVRSEMQQWQPAAAALQRATEIDGGMAYAHYYAGMAYNKIKKMDRMAQHLARFLELAPNAPEREQVQQVLRVLKGIR
jgi:tetratricopeptide (TPR) repeat protein